MYPFETLRLQAAGTALLVRLDVRSTADVWGPMTWTLIEERLIRLTLVTMAERSQLMVRAGFDARSGEFMASFQYNDLRLDFAQALYGVFSVLDVPPTILDEVPVEPGAHTLCGAFGGAPYLFVRSATAPKAGGLKVDDLGIRWVTIPFPTDSVFSGSRGEALISYALRTPERSAEGIRLKVEQQVPLRVAVLAEE